MSSMSIFQMVILIPAVAIAAALDWRARRIPNVLCVAIAVAGPWMLKVIVNYTQALIINIPSMIR